MVEVLFLMEKVWEDSEPSVIAFFPNKKYDNVEGNMYGYTHGGGFSCVGVDYANKLQEATKEQYKPLERELRKRVLGLIVINKD
jgi:hypothetical protein